MEWSAKGVGTNLNTVLGPDGSDTGDIVGHRFVESSHNVLAASAIHVHR